jgi:exodeoxyribonuclease VII small subunit
MTDKARREEAPIEGMSFEDAMAELEHVVEALEKGEVPLEESITLYERGARLKAHCEAKLKAAEERVERLTLNSQGQPQGTQPFDAE